MRSIRTIILTGLSQNQQSNPNLTSRLTSLPTQTEPQNNDGDSDLATDPNIESRNRSKPKFRLEVSLGRLQNYYSKGSKFGGDFEDDLEDAMAEFDTAGRGQLAPDEAKSELFSLTIQGLALTFDLRSRSTTCLLYTSPSPRDQRGPRMPSSA